MPQRIISERSDRAWYSTWQRKTWDQEFSEYIKKHNSFEGVNWESEYTARTECEAAVFSQMIFGELFKAHFGPDRTEFAVNSYYSVCSLDGKRSFSVLYDVMNTNDLTSEQRHCIGNYTCYPSLDGVTLQFIHKWHKEDWPAFLNWLRDNWDEKTVSYGMNRYCQSASMKDKWGMTFEEYMTFEDYMILTCQQMYYGEIYSGLKENRFNSVSDINRIIKEKSGKLQFVRSEKADLDFLISIRQKFIESVVFKCCDPLKGN